MNICSITCTTVCQAGMREPPTACLTDGTLVVRVRSSHQITAATDSPTNTDTARRHAGTANGPGAETPST